VVAAQKDLIGAHASRWLRRGGPIPADPESLANVCDKLVRAGMASSLKRALRTAEAFHRRATQSKNPRLIYSSTRALARVTHVHGRHGEALRLYLRARAMAEQLRDRLGVPQIDRALIDVYMYVNKYPDAEKAAGRAIKAFRAQGADRDAVQAEVNLANLYHRQDRHRDAERIYAHAERFFVRIDNPLAQARIAYNRGNTQVQLFDWEAAVESYRRAHRIYAQKESGLDANDASYGLAYIELLSDRYADALVMLAQCQDVYRDSGDPRGAALCVLDRAEAFLGLNLFDEALASAQSAGAQFRRLKLRYETAKAMLYGAYALAGLNRRAEARRAVTTALRAFVREKNLGLAGAGRLLSAQLEEGATRMLALREARRTFHKAQLPLWSTLCDLQLLAEPHHARAAGRRLAHNVALRRVPHWSALYDTLQGERALRAGRQEDARAHWQRAARTLEHVRSALPPLELRSSYLSGRTDPYRKLIALEAQSDPLSAAEWAERLKTAGLWAPLHTAASADPDAERLLAEWNRLSARLAALARHVPASSSGAGRALVAREAEQQMRALERRGRRVLADIETRSLRFEEPGGQVRDLIRSLASRLRIVLWHCANDDLYAFVFAGADAQTHVWRGGVSRLNTDLRRWRFLMESHMQPGNGSSPEALLAGEQSFWAEVGEWLWRPLEIPSDGAPALLIPEGPLFALPFCALWVDGGWLGDRHRFIISPSLRHYADAANRSLENESGLQLFEAPAANLPAVHDEVRAISTLLADTSFKLHSPATREALLGAPPSRLWHFAGHARFRSDNPFYSALQLSDGPVFAADLRTRRVPVGLATLSACHSGGGVAAPGEEFAGFVRSIMEMGARSVVAALWPVADESTSVWMCEFYKHWLRGAALTDAVLAAQVHVRERWPSPYHWAAFSLFGMEK
jgi:hypothetical protein